MIVYILYASMYRLQDLVLPAPHTPNYLTSLCQSETTAHEENDAPRVFLVNDWPIEERIRLPGVLDLVQPWDLVWQTEQYDGDEN